MSIIIGESIVKAKINHGDFIMLHKAEVDSIITNSKILDLKSELSERIGTFILGLSSTLYFVPNVEPYTVILFFIVGVYFTYTSLKSKKEKNKPIERLFDEKMSEAKNIKS